MKKFYALTLLIVLAMAGCAQQPLPNVPVDNDGNKEVNTADDAPAVNDTATPIDDSSMSTSEIFSGDSVVATDYYTLEVVETALSSKEWLDEQYKDYSGSWSWDFDEYTFGYGDGGTYNGFLALRKEPGMYVEYVLIPKDGKLYVFRTETAMKLSPDAEGYVQEREPRVKEIVTKLSQVSTDAVTDTTADTTTTTTTDATTESAH